jgi:release factor glutamine methyltransferase
MVGEHKPRMDEERAQKLRLWQDALYQDLQRQQTTTTEFLGRTFVIPPNVHMINPMSDLIGNSVLRNVGSNDRVLDMGTGCGVNAILAASVSNDVVAVDVNPVAIEAAKANARRNGVESSISFYVSDLFTSVVGEFDVIIFDPPFRWFKPREACEIATTDENYQTLVGFFEEFRNYLKKDGRLIICFGSSGDIKYLYELIGKTELEKEIIAHRKFEKDGLAIDYYTFLITTQD